MTHSLLHCALARGARLASGAALLLLGAAAALPARASVPPGPPVFSNPTNITNSYAPFVPGGVKVYAGHDGGSKTVLVDLFLPGTRVFDIGPGQHVETRILQETEFDDGRINEISANYFAQADDGTVYYFGEVVDTYEDGVVTGHGGSWLVGGPTAPGDPEETANAPAPAIFMPANPEEGDVFKPEDLPPIVDETDTVKDVDLTVQTPAGKFHNAIRIIETSSLDSGSETKWYAAGVGVLKGKTKGEAFALQATTIAPPEGP
jgi:hypothetical protein